MIRLGYIAPILLIALPLAACEKKDNPFEAALTLMNGGTPVPAGAASVSLSQTVETVEPVAVVAEAPAVSPADCVVPAHLFRSMQCDEVTGLIVPIR